MPELGARKTLDFARKYLQDRGKNTVTLVDKVESIDQIGELGQVKSVLNGSASEKEAM